MKRACSGSLAVMLMVGFLSATAFAGSDADGSPDALDCAPNNPDIYPGALEICNGKDDNCGGKPDEGGVCGQNCQTQFWGGHVYLFCSPEIGWADAKQACRGYGNAGYRLVAVDSAAENAWLSQAASAQGLTGGESAVWLGFNDRAAEGAFEWSNRSTATYVGWTGVEPNNAGAGENCAGLRDGGGWLDYACDASLPYVCELGCGGGNDTQMDSDGDGIGDGCDVYPDDPGNDADGDGLAAGDDPCPLQRGEDLDDDGVCGTFDVCPVDPANDADGDGVCAIPESDDTPADCDDTRATVRPGADEFCDGLDNDCDGDIDEDIGEDADQNGVPDLCETDTDQDGSVDGNDCAIHNPDIFPGAVELCDGKDNDCSGRADDGQAACPSCSVEHIDDHRYLVCPIRRSWSSAQDYCRGRNYRLVSVDSEAENTALNELVSQTFGVEESAWMGFQDTDADSTFMWDNASQTTFTRWAEGQPDDLNGAAGCAQWQPGVGTATWETAECSQPANFVCEWGCGGQDDDQPDTDQDGLADGCDPWPDDADNDIDGDGVGGSRDLCPQIANPDQTDIDEDGLGGPCDDDDDDDGIPDADDLCHAVADEVDDDGCAVDPGEGADAGAMDAGSQDAGSQDAGTLTDAGGTDAAGADARGDAAARSSDGSASSARGCGVLGGGSGGDSTPAGWLLAIVGLALGVRNSRRNPSQTDPR